jgi:hypothetical protein
MVRTAGLEPALSNEKQIFVPLRLSPPPCHSRVALRGRWRSWSGLSLRHNRPTRPVLGAPRLVSTPSLPTTADQGLARDWPGRRATPLAFPEFGRFYTADFPAGTPMKSAASTISPRPLLHSHTIPPGGTGKMVGFAVM